MPPEEFELAIPATEKATDLCPGPLDSWNWLSFQLQFLVFVHG
jgi:hypothetical protein